MEEFLSNSPDETIKIGSHFSQKLKGGEIVSITGELGAGKTVFVKGIATGLGIDRDEVSSPSFTLMNIYSGRLNLCHVDLYRIKEDENLEVEIFEILDYNTLVVVEWAENLRRILQMSNWHVTIEMIDEKNRRIKIYRRG